MSAEKESVVSRRVVPGSRIGDERTFHEVFAEAFGFPGFYGNNFDAWIDCMTSLDNPQAGMTSVHVAPGQLLTIEIQDADHMKKSCPDVWLAFLESAAFVNWRRAEMSLVPVIVVSASA